MAEVTVQREVLGYLKQEEVRAVHVPREWFVGVVNKTIDRRPEYEPIRDLMVETAKRVERFPFFTWVDPVRGCGCLVGEYLIAHDILSREEAALQAKVSVLTYENPDAAAALGVEALDVSEELSKVHDEETAKLLSMFGNTIDGQLRHSMIVDFDVNESGGDLATVLVIDDE
jgi:hypothetical protein